MKKLEKDALELVIIGGQGEMGHCFKKLFRKADANVRVFDVDDDLHSASVKEILAKADITVVSVPMNVFYDVVQEIGRYLKSGSLLMDICSLKAKQTNAMLRACPADVEVLGAHPLFGPYPSLEEQCIVLCPVRSERWFPKIKQLFQKLGLQVVCVHPESHDKIMAMVQALLHVLMFSFAETIDDLGGLGEAAAKSSLNKGNTALWESQAYQISPPIFKLVWLFVGRLLNQDKQLYSAISIDNQYSLRGLKILSGHIQQYCSILQNQDKKGFERKFLYLQKKLFAKDTGIMKESQDLIDFFANQERKRRQNQKV